MNAIAEDLWPTDIVENLPITPVNILKAQASRIGEKTKNIVEGRVETYSYQKDQMIHSFKLVAPALSNYTYELFRLVHPIQLYPVVVIDTGKPLRSEEELVEWLKEKLAEPRTGQIVRSLIAQSS